MGPTQPGVRCGATARLSITRIGAHSALSQGLLDWAPLAHPRLWEDRMAWLWSVGVGVMRAPERQGRPGLECPAQDPECSGPLARPCLQEVQGDSWRLGWFQSLGVVPEGGGHKPRALGLIRGWRRRGRGCAHLV